MKNEFISYEQALALKELGFDEPCFGYWNIDPYLPNPIFNLVKPFDHEWCIPAPLYQQAFRWFREKYGLHVNKTGNANYTSFNMTEPKIEVLSFVRYTDTKNHYQQAEDNCINKLIELLKLKR